MRHNSVWVPEEDSVDLLAAETLALWQSCLALCLTRVRGLEYLQKS